MDDRHGDGQIFHGYPVLLTETHGQIVIFFGKLFPGGQKVPPVLRHVIFAELFQLIRGDARPGKVEQRHVDGGIFAA